MGIYITGQEIKELAEYAGFSVELDSDDDYIMEHEFQVAKCHDDGVLDDDGVILKSNLVVKCDGCELGECMPIGETEVIGHS